MSDNGNHDGEEPGGILPEPIGEDGFARPEGGADGDAVQNRRDREPLDDRGRPYSGTDGDPIVADDVRRS